MYSHRLAFPFGPFFLIFWPLCHHHPRLLFHFLWGRCSAAAISSGSGGGPLQSLSPLWPRGGSVDPPAAAGVVYLPPNLQALFLHHTVPHRNHQYECRSHHRFPYSGGVASPAFQLRLRLRLHQPDRKSVV